MLTHSRRFFHTRLGRVPALLTVAAVVAVGRATPAGAQTSYSSLAAFLAASPGATATNSLDGIAIPDPPGYVAPVIGIAFGGITLATLGDPAGPAFPTQFLAQATSGIGNSYQVADGGLTRFAFSRAVRGLGAAFLSLGSIGNVTFSLYSGATLVGTSTLFARSEGYSGFYGLLNATAFDRVDIRAVSGEFYELDDPVVAASATVTPEPSGVALLGLGIVALALGGRRRGTTDRLEHETEVTRG